MGWSIEKRSQSVESAALIAASRDAADSVAAVGIWVVWIRAGRALACERSSRLDAAVTVDVQAAADAVVVIAVSPTRLAQPVVGRAEVICEYLAANGFRVHAVHVRALREGVLWTALRGRALAGVVPAPHPPAPNLNSHHQAGGVRPTDRPLNCANEIHGCR